MFGLGIWELLVILAIVLLLFGTKRLKGLGGDLGNAIKGFRSAISEEDEARKPRDARDERVIDADVGRNDHDTVSGKKQDTHV